MYREQEYKNTENNPEIQGLKDEMITLRGGIKELHERQTKIEKIVEKLDSQIQTIVHIQQRMMEWVKNK